MNDRERWIIYPLLFLALGVALRDKIFKTTASQRVMTECLLLTDGDGEVIAVLENERLNSTPPGTRIEGRLAVKNIHGYQISGTNLIVNEIRATKIQAEEIVLNNYRLSHALRMLETLRQGFAFLQRVAIEQATRSPGRAEVTPPDKEIKSPDEGGQEPAATDTPPKPAQPSATD